jgi:hypothetical protein
MKKGWIFRKVVTVLFVRFGRGNRGATERIRAMAKPQKTWFFDSPRWPVPQAVKAEMDAKIADLIENVLKPKHLQPPPEGHLLNYIVDIKAKWLGSKCYLISVYRTPRLHKKPTRFETKFARMEYVGNAKFSLSFMRHTGQWLRLYERTSVDECIRAIQVEPWFQP